MLESHGRYDYSRSPNAPTTRGPAAGASPSTSAVNIEAFRYGRGMGAANRASRSGDEPQPSYSWRDYGNRVGIWRLLSLFDALDLPIEAQMNTAIYTHCPQNPPSVAPPRRRDPRPRRHQQRRAGRALRGRRAPAHRRGVTATIEREEGARPAGWMSPWLSNSEVTADLLAEAGYRYFMDWTCDDQPVWMRTDTAASCRCPTPSSATTPWHRVVPAYLRGVRGHDRRRLRRDAGAERGPTSRLPDLAPSVRGRPAPIASAGSAGRWSTSPRTATVVWIARPRDLCAHIENLPDGIVCGS